METGSKAAGGKQDRDQSLYTQGLGEGLWLKIPSRILEGSLGGAYRDSIITSTAALKMFSNLAYLYYFILMLLPRGKYCQLSRVEHIKKVNEYWRGAQAFPDLLPILQ